MSATIRTLALTLPLLAALAPAPASAVVASTDTTFYFTGTCSDCTGTVTGELVLRDYTPGQEISGFYKAAGNFVSFHYDGSDLLPEFTISAMEGTASGSIDGPLPGPQQVSVSNGPYRNGYYFSSAKDGTWSVGTYNSEILFDADRGTAGTFSLAAATAVPEPASLALLATGLLGIRLARRRPG